VTSALGHVLYECFLAVTVHNVQLCN